VVSLLLRVTTHSSPAPASKSASLLGRARPLIAARLASACITLVIPLVLARMMLQAEYGTYKLLFLVSMTAAAILPCGVAQSLYFFVPRAHEPRVYLGQTLAFMLVTGLLGGVVLALGGGWLSSALSTPALAEHRYELAAYVALLVAASPLEVSITTLRWCCPRSRAWGCTA
jgi:O-antigen/teichoic acid export membrane protein